MVIQRIFNSKILTVLQQLLAYTSRYRIVAFIHYKSINISATFLTSSSFLSPKLLINVVFNKGQDQMTTHTLRSVPHTCDG